MLQTLELNYTYGTSNNDAGFFIERKLSTPDLPGFQNENAMTYFEAIGGDGFVDMSTVADYAKLLIHPDVSFTYSNEGIDSLCASQLNVSIANSWGQTGSSWTDQAPKL